LPDVTGIKNERQNDARKREKHLTDRQDGGRSALLEADQRAGRSAARDGAQVGIPQFPVAVPAGRKQEIERQRRPAGGGDGGSIGISKIKMQSAKLI